MATLEELHNLGDGDLINKITAACAIVADEIRVETPPANSAERLKWAKEAFLDPGAKARQMIWALLAANQSAAITAIQGASDAAILGNVRDAVNIFADN